VPGTEQERGHRKQTLTTQTPLELLAKEVEAKDNMYFVNIHWYFNLISFIQQ